MAIKNVLFINLNIRRWCIYDALMLTQSYYLKHSWLVHYGGENKYCSSKVRLVNGFIQRKQFSIEI